jgi:CBS-domain-containing membrane protein
VLEGPRLAGIITERDVLDALARPADLDETEVANVMTRDVVVVGPDWEIYEAAAEMAARRIRHLVVGEHGKVLGVVSVRDLLLAGQRVELGKGQWAQLRDSLTFTIRERRKLQRLLPALSGVPVGEADLAALTGLLVGSWSLNLPLPPDADAVPEREYEALGDAVLAKLPELQRAVRPTPGWRRR